MHETVDEGGDQRAPFRCRVIEGDADLSDLRSNHTALRLACADDLDSDDAASDATDGSDQDCLTARRSRFGSLAVPRRLARRLLARIKPAAVSRSSETARGSLQHAPSQALAPSQSLGLQQGAMQVGQAEEQWSSQDEREHVLGAAADRARTVMEREAEAEEADRKRVWQDRHHGEIGPERADYHSHVAPAWLGLLLPFLSSALRYWSPFFCADAAR
jgi:hypothetical protein